MAAIFEDVKKHREPPAGTVPVNHLDGVLLRAHDPVGHPPPLNSCELCGRRCLVCHDAAGIYKATFAIAQLHSFSPHVLLQFPMHACLRARAW